MKQIITYSGYIMIMFAAFFPAYLGYMSQYAWIGYITTIIFALLTYVPFVRYYALKGGYVLGLLAIVGLIIESIGVLTCVPYGCFMYSEQLGPKLLSIVPYMLICTWPPLVIGIRSIVKNYFPTGLLRWIVGSIGLVLVDLVLDPLAVLMGLWSYPGGGRWRGVPRSNFGGWLISGFIGLMIVDLMIGNTRQDNKYYIGGLITTLIFFVSYGLRKLILSI